MNTKKILIITLIAVAILVSVSVVSAGLFDGLFKGEQKDNVIEIDNITFNTTNVTKFNLLNETDGDGGYWKWYMDENKTGYNVNIYNCSEYFNKSDKTHDWGSIMKSIKGSTYENVPSQTVNGIVVYTISATSGEHVGEPRYSTLIENRDLYTVVTLSSPDPNETAKMASTLKFK